MSAQAIDDHLGMLFAALYVSEGWHLTYRDLKDSRNRHERKLAIYSRARSMVLFDRALNGEMRA